MNFMKKNRQNLEKRKIKESKLKRKRKKTN